MPENTQWVGKSFDPVVSNSWGLGNWARSMVDFQRKAIEQSNREAEAQKDTDLRNLYLSSLTVKDHWVADDCNATYRLWLVTKWIRDYFSKPENWWYDYKNVDDDVLYDSYVANNPDRKWLLDRFVLDDSQICDPTQLYYDMWWEEREWEEKEEEKSDTNPRVEAWTNIAWAVTESVLWLPKFVWNTSADIAAWTLKLFWWDEEKANAAAEEVKSFLDKISFWNEDSLLYKWTKITSDLLLAYLMWKGLFPQTSIGNLWWGTKSVLGAAQWAWDMALYSMISEQELPSKTDLNIGMGIWAFLPYWWLLLKGGRNLLKSVWKKEIENAIPKVSKLTETRQDKFLKEFDQSFEEWMRERNLTTYDDVKNYFDASKKTKLEALKQIKWRYKSKEVDDVLDWCVDYAQRTDDPRLEEFLELQTKNNEWWLEMWESEKVKQYFWDKWVFNFDSTKTSEEVDKMTNWYEKLMKWQRKVAKENWFDNLAEINNEIQAWWYLNRYVRDLTKIWKKWMSLLDFFIAASTWDWKTAAGYLLSKRILSWAKTNEKYAKLLQWLFKNWNGDKLVVDYEKIQSFQDEKEFIKYLEEMWAYNEKLPFIEWAKNEAWLQKTILESGEPMISTPEWETFFKKDNNWRISVDFVK